MFGDWPSFRLDPRPPLRTILTRATSIALRLDALGRSGREAAMGAKSMDLPRPAWPYCCDGQSEMDIGWASVPGPFSDTMTALAFLAQCAGWMTIITAVLATVSDPAPAQTTSSQHWPSRVPTIVVSFPAGGPTDVLARAVATDLAERLGQQFVV